MEIGIKKCRPINLFIGSFDERKIKNVYKTPFLFTQPLLQLNIIFSTLMLCAAFKESLNRGRGVQTF